LSKDLTKPSVYGIGIFGIGAYECRDSTGKVTLAYSIWSNMLRRCYTNYSTNKSAEAYINVKVDPHWHTFQNFAKWFYDRYEPYQINNIIPKLDKDLFGSNLYSENNCVLVPNIINCFLSDKRKTSVICHGVTKRNNKYLATIMHKSKPINLGVFNDLDSALLAYRTKKKILLANLADEYKHVLENKTYDMLVNWKHTGELNE